MTAASPPRPHPACASRAIRSPALRRAGVPLFLIMARSSMLVADLAATPPAAIAAAAAMAALAIALYAGFVRLAQRRPLAEFAPAGLRRELPTGLILGAGRTPLWCWS